MKISLLMMFLSARFHSCTRRLSPTSEAFGRIDSAEVVGCGGLPTAAEALTPIEGAASAIGGESSLPSGAERLSYARFDGGGGGDAGSSSGGEKPLAPAVPCSLRRAHASEKKTPDPFLEDDAALAEPPPEHWRAAAAAAGGRPSSRVTGDPARWGNKPPVFGAGAGAGGSGRWRPHSTSQPAPLDRLPSSPPDYRPSPPSTTGGLDCIDALWQDESSSASSSSSSAKDAAVARRGAPPPNSAAADARSSDGVGAVLPSRVEQYLRRCGRSPPSPPPPPLTGTSSNINPSSSLPPAGDDGGIGKTLTTGDANNFSRPPSSTSSDIETRGVIAQEEDGLDATKLDERAAPSPSPSSSCATPPEPPALEERPADGGPSSEGFKSGKQGGAAVLDGPSRQPVPVDDSLIRSRSWFNHVDPGNWNWVNVPASRAAVTTIASESGSGAGPDLRDLGSTVDTDNVRGRRGSKWSEGSCCCELLMWKPFVVCCAGACRITVWGGKGVKKKRMSVFFEPGVCTSYYTCSVSLSRSLSLENGLG